MPTRVKCASQVTIKILHPNNTRAQAETRLKPGKSFSYDWCNTVGCTKTSLRTALL